MSLEISEDLASLAYQSLGYFVREGVRVGLNEIDILAVKLEEDGRIGDRLHVEVSISTNPIDNWTLDDWSTWIDRKYEAPRIVQVVRAALGGDYRKVYVHGVLVPYDDSQILALLDQRRVEHVELGCLVQRALAQCKYRNRLRRACDIAGMIWAASRG